MSERRELYRSTNGDAWFLGREPTNGNAFIIHQPNAPSGGRLSHIELGEFLRSDVRSPVARDICGTDGGCTALICHCIP